MVMHYDDLGCRKFGLLLSLPYPYRYDYDDDDYYFTTAATAATPTSLALVLSVLLPLLVLPVSLPLVLLHVGYDPWLVPTWLGNRFTGHESSTGFMGVLGRSAVDT